MKLLIALLALGFLSNVQASDTLGKLIAVAQTVKSTKPVDSGVVTYKHCEISGVVWVPQGVTKVVLVGSTLEEQAMIIFHGPAKPISTSQIPAHWEIIFVKNPGVVYLLEGSKIKGEVLNGSIDNSKNGCQSKL